MSQQHASVSQGRICLYNYTCCQTERGIADQTFYLTWSQYTDTGPTSPSADLITSCTWQGNHWNTNAQVTGMTRPGQRATAKAGTEPRCGALEADALTTRPTRLYRTQKSNHWSFRHSHFQLDLSGENMLAGKTGCQLVRT